MTNRNWRITLFSALLITTIAGICSSAAAEETTETAVSEKAHSVNINSFGLLFGQLDVGANYEYLLNGYHGFLVEGEFSRINDEDAKSVSGGGLVGYRLHWSGEQDSGFVGLNLGYSVGSSDATVASGGTTTVIPVETRAFTILPNIGKRWAWDFGLNITIRFGIGYGNYDISTTSDDPAAQEGVQLVDDLLTAIPVAFDGELSIGWNF